MSSIKSSRQPSMMAPSGFSTTTNSHGDSPGHRRNCKILIATMTGFQIYRDEAGSRGLALGGRPRHPGNVQNALDNHQGNHRPWGPFQQFLGGNGASFRARRGAFGGGATSGPSGLCRRAANDDQGKHFDSSFCKAALVHIDATQRISRRTGAGIPNRMRRHTPTILLALSKVVAVWASMRVPSRANPTVETCPALVKSFQVCKMEGSGHNR
ncbi:hypothetical protein IWX46DRAFT_143312 [Phyllosticta citricarpa]|uniref:Uncharacterized protein n=1 Tax=Phyllosticta citricarpa TaxID=55181 RepID=A0ABR1MQ61_9PEZI